MFHRSRNISKKSLVACLGLLVALTNAVGGASAKGVSEGATNQLKIVATTGMIADAARNVAGPLAEVEALMGPGVDPHLYRATPNDMRQMSQADLILYNGLTLEGKMVDILIRIARQIPTYAVTDYIADDALLEPASFNGLYDPHVWWDAELWMTAVERIRDAFIDVDPEHKAVYEENATAYMQSLNELHAYVNDRVSTIPTEQRVLVTAHDAFNYFGRAYGVEVVGLQGLSTDTEFGIADVQRLIDLLVDRNIKAVFVESSVSERGMRAVVEGAAAMGHDVVIGGTLFSDALGEAGTPDGDYIGAFRHNVETIVAGLR